MEITQGFYEILCARLGILWATVRFPRKYDKICGILQGKRVFPVGRGAKAQDMTGKTRKRKVCKVWGVSYFVLLRPKWSYQKNGKNKNFLRSGYMSMSRWEYRKEAIWDTSATSRDVLLKRSTASKQFRPHASASMLLITRQMFSRTHFMSVRPWEK